MKALYIFATSRRPDPYVNVIVHASRYMEVGRVRLIMVRDPDAVSRPSFRPGSDAEASPTSLVTDIVTSLTALSEGRYAGEEDEAPESIAMTAADRDLYRECLNHLNDHGITGSYIRLSDLDDRLRDFLAHDECIFDVSAAKKSLLVGVVALLISLGSPAVYSFELLKRQSYDYADLYHAVAPVHAFLYRNLAESEPVRTALRRVTARSLRFKRVLGLTAIIAVVLVISQVFLARTWLTTLIAGLSTLAGLSSFLVLLVWKDER
jgi:hypothetical protein